MVKKLKFICILFLAFCIAGCGMSESQVEKNKNENSEIENTEETKEQSMVENDNNSLIYSIMEIPLEKSKQYGVKLFEFEERKEVLNFLNTQNANEIFNNTISVKANLDSTVLNNGEVAYRTNYKKTVDETEFLYYGEVNENSEPTGMGIILEKIPVENNDPLIFVTYVGNFKNGFYDGYGISFEYPEMFAVFDDEVYIKNQTLFNGRIISEGYFSQGLYNGNINYFECDINNAIWGLEDPMDDLTLDDLIYNIKVATYENDILNGKYTEYIYGELAFTGEVENGIPNGEGKKYQTYSQNHFLEYEGNFENGVYSGYGKQYSTTTGKLIYEGYFKDGVYNGKGILYDENTGEIKHEGEFYNGDIK